ncbi:MAG: putative GTP-binding protein EngB [Steroidobacteraceae bacterium]|nr:putative GTP-binding protein EngB [Steroidobacteraceae bacterium]
MSRFPNAHFMLSVAAPAQFPADDGAEAAFAGRSNAGKSSAINALTQRKALARTSKTPGQTRLLNYFELAPGRRIVDLPGYGYATAPPAERAKWAPLIERLRARQSLRGLLLVVDARRGIGEEDERLIAWAGPTERRVHVLLAKADKLTRNEARAALAAARAALDDSVTVQLLSSQTGAGVPEAQRALLDML